MYVFCRVLSHLALQAAVSMTQVYSCPYIPAVVEAYVMLFMITS